MVDRPRPVVVLTADELEQLIERAVAAGVRAYEEAHAGERADDGWLETAEVAELMRLHPRSITKLAKTGELPSARVGKLLRFKRGDVEAFLARRKAG